MPRSSCDVGWRDLTPQHLRCGTGGCPAVFQASTGSLIIVGRTLDANASHSFLNGRVSSAEAAIEIDSAYFGEFFGRKG